MPTITRSCPQCGARQGHCACPTRDQRRGTPHERGYDTHHRLTRRTVARHVATGQATCAHPRCGQPINPHEPWDLAHTPDRTSYLGPMHAACNRATAGDAQRWSAHER